MVGIDLGTSHVAVASLALADAVAHAVAGPVSASVADVTDDGIAMLPIAQLVGPAQVDARMLLPSLRYHPAPGELDAASLNQPWPTWQPPPDAELQQAIASYVHQGEAVEHPPAVIGTHARTLGAQVPSRLVSSAKSWLSHAGVDRTAPILPWGAPPDVPRVSPLHATASYLAHVRSAWDRRHPDAPLAQQAVCITVPASFDEGARALTVEAARLVGLQQVQLLEEPQAALTDWLQQPGPALAQQLQGVRLVLVVDVGGGTTDFSLMAVEPAGDAGPQLVRLTVGEHLMLGGDNMDLAIAHALEAPLSGGTRLSAARFALLVQQCRAAKERLLAADAPESLTVTLLGAGASVLGGSRSAVLTREQVAAWVVDGFLPQEGAEVLPRKRQSALVGFGLPHPADSAITRHLAAFLARSAPAMRQHLDAVMQGPAGIGSAGTSTASEGPGRDHLSELGPDDGARLPVPDAVLFNGGVFHAAALVERLTAVLTRWRGTPVRVLHNPHPDWAVARGAVAHLWGRHQSDWVSIHRSHEQIEKTGIPAVDEGGEPAPSAPLVPVPRIRAGSARSYFLWLQPADDTAAARMQAVCLLPHGQATGVVHALPQRFMLRLGEPVRFQLLASSLPTPWRAGEVVDVAALEAVWLPPLTTQIDAEDGSGASTGTGAVGRTARDVAVHVQASLSEVGTLEVACVCQDAPAGEAPTRWPLVFAVRGAQATVPAEASASPPDALTGRAVTPPWAAVAEGVTALVDEVFGEPAHAVDAGTVRRLRQALERRLGRRDTWPVALLRPLFDLLMARARRRRRSAEHERVWFNLAGYCLRPGLGEPRDAQRMASLWALHDDGLSYPKGQGNWAEWWICWRRVAAGLNEAQQMALMSSVAGALEHADQRHRAADSPLVAEGDMVRLVAVLENLSAPYRAELGEWLVQHLPQAAAATPTWWALGRTGARVPLHGSPHNVVAPELVQAWITTALAQDWRRNDAAMFAAVQMSRMTGDRARDVDEATRAQVLQRLQQARAPERWRTLVAEVVALSDDDLQRSVGEALPPGLRLLER
ncbi:hypothetical protein CCO03_18660 [Comamonas serinivorans]|uniref:Molecular chaperone DnaK n=1 Tax=Comamonas serinivorans TaxID=1082851 RepID=A0A1Y0ESQ5_9BURK|nr:hypothetical protein CCO03_18660 [Comamonas serinivorans]